MATLFQSAATRQPFAPINGSRLQNLTSLKNRQNALPTTLNSPIKRKADVYDTSDSENVDPVLFASPKRSKGKDGTTTEIFKPSNFILTKAPASPTDFSALSPNRPSLNISRPMLQPRSPAPKLNTTSISNLSAPAGRSPTRKRIGILNRRRTASTSTFGTRVDPPSFGASAAAPPFSLAAALSGTIPSYKSQAPKPVTASLHEPETKAGWFFEIHEDTEEETLHNLMEHGACTLDISSDEEVERRARDERGKENVPPLDDVSQTRTLTSTGMSQAHEDTVDSKALARLARRKKVEEGAIDIDRSPLGEMAAEEFYPEGYTAGDVILIAEDEELDKSTVTFDFTVEESLSIKGKEREVDFEEWLNKPAAPAKVLEPIEKAEENFEVWESGSAKGDE